MLGILFCAHFVSNICSIYVSLFRTQSNSIWHYNPQFSTTIFSDNFSASFFVRPISIVVIFNDKIDRFNGIQKFVIVYISDAAPEV